MKIKMEICTTKVLLFFVWLYVRVQDGKIRLSLYPFFLSLILAEIFFG